VPAQYLVVTLHRPALVDGDLLTEAFRMLRRVSRELPIVFPAHPRTLQPLEAQKLLGAAEEGLSMLEPIGYFEFLSLMSAAAGVLTDSGGIQEETTYLGIRASRCEPIPSAR
jgi:UDP-N-acetylglucosamine 2-epimerase (non-hydrolysing)